MFGRGLLDASHLSASPGCDPVSKCGSLLPGGMTASDYTSKGTELNSVPAHHPPSCCTRGCWDCGGLSRAIRSTPHRVHGDIYESSDYATASLIDLRTTNGTEFNSVPGLYNPAVFYITFLSSRPLCLCGFLYPYLCALSVTAPCVTLPPASMQSCASAVNTLFSPSQIPRIARSYLARYSRNRRTPSSRFCIEVV
jgi:hypothetical protein